MASKNNLAKVGGIALAVAITGAAGFGYSSIGGNSEISQAPTDPLSEILQANNAINLGADFLTDGPISQYDGPIPADVQKCLDTPLTAKELENEDVYAPFNRAFNTDLTRDDIIADIGPVLGYAVDNQQVNWEWDGLSKTYKFKGHEDDSKLWYCYFKEGSPFFQEFLSTEEISTPFEDISTISFTEILPEPAPDGGIKHESGFEGLEMDEEFISDLKSFEDGILDKIRTEMQTVGAEFDKFEELSHFNQDLLPPTFSDLDFWDKLETRKSDTQKVLKFDKELFGSTLLKLGEIELDTTKEFDIANLEQELNDKVKLEKITDPITGADKILVKLSEQAVNQNTDVDSHISSLKLKKVGDVLAEYLDEDNAENTVKTVSTFELIAEIDSAVAEGTRYQAIINGNVLPDVLNENGQEITNPIDDPIYSEVIEIAGAPEFDCAGQTPHAICGIESAQEALEANHSDLELKVYPTKCEFEKVSATFLHEGDCTAEDIADLEE